MVLKFLQRHALVVAILGGLIGRRLILPGDSRWWLELGVTMAITLPICLLLHKDGVTRHTTKR